MGTKVQIESRFPGYFSMRDHNEDSNSCGWPLFYGDRNFTNGQCYNGFLPRTAVDVYSGYDKDEVKRTMLEHEAIFKNQLCELHRLYRTQRDLMNEAKRTELNKKRILVETCLSSSPLASQITCEDARKWHIPLGNEGMHSPLRSMKGSIVQGSSPLLSRNAVPSKDIEVLESRPMKVRRKMFDLHLPADEYIDTEVGEQLMDENGKSNLADLNEPVEFEDTNTSSNDRLGCSSHYEIDELELGGKPKSEFFGFSRDILANSLQDTSNGALHGSYLQNNGNRKSWFPYMLDSGNSKNNLLSVTQDLQPEKLPSSSEKIQVLLNKNNESATLFLTHQSKADQLRERTIQGSQLVDHSSDLSKTWSETISSWEKLNGSLNQKSMSVQEHPCLSSSATLSRSCHSSTQSHVVFGNRWNYNANAVPENSVKLYKKSNCSELSPSKYQEVINLERNHDDDVVTLPWLQTKPNCKNEPSSYPGVDLNADMDSLNLSSDSSEGGNGKVPNQLILQNTQSTSCANGAEFEAIDSSSCRKILGFPIFEKPHISKIESLHPQPSEVVEYNRINRVLDINLPCDEDVSDTAAQTETQVMPLERETRIQIDLNSCITEDEACLTPSITGSNVKTISGIDLEAPAVPEEEEDIVPRQVCMERANPESSEQPMREKDESLADECIRTAAKAMVAISLSGKDSHGDAYHLSKPCMADPLQWFVELVSSFGEDDNNFRNNDGYSSEDYFESMTLRLKETKEEDYMPKPLVPENLILPEASTSLLTTRTRRGNARRGRQRRDFQRDILPGLASLTRHEVTEDLQTFGGIMRATGHSWNSGLTRRNTTRNGCGRGRRRSLINASPPPPPPLIEHLNNVEVGLEDRRNLTGWGKTTRRPRRQRCPPGNPLVLPVSDQLRTTV